MLYEFKGFVLRCFLINNEIWFYGNDVAISLGHTNPSKAISAHTSPSDRYVCEYRKYAVSNDSLESNIRSLWTSSKDKRDKILINESGLYCLIFGSRTEKSEEFKLWVTRVVIPSIRMNNGYILDQETLTAEQQQSLFKKIAKLTDEVKALKEQNAKLQARRHELLAEQRALKARTRKQKKDIKDLNKYADLWEDMYDKTVSELNELRDKIFCLSKKQERLEASLQPAQPTAVVKKDVRPVASYKVDMRTGFRVLNI